MDVPLGGSAQLALGKPESNLVRLVLEYPLASVKLLWPVLGIVPRVDLEDWRVDDNLLLPLVMLGLLSLFSFLLDVVPAKVNGLEEISVGEGAARMDVSVEI